MASSDGKRLKYMLPRAENLLRLSTYNVIRGLKDGVEIKLVMAPLVSRAYTIVNETGVIPYKDYDADDVFLKE